MRPRGRIQAALDASTERSVSALSGDLAHNEGRVDDKPGHDRATITGRHEALETVEVVGIGPPFGERGQVSGNEFAGARVAAAEVDPAAADR